MNVFFNSDNRITDFSLTNEKGDGNFIHCPDSIKTVEVSYTDYQPKKDSFGRLLYVTDNGIETTEPITNFCQNIPLIEPIVKTKQSDFRYDPLSITVDGVIKAKYKALSNGRKYWCDEFFTPSSLADFHTSAFNVHCVQIPVDGSITLCPIFTDNITEFEVSIEAGDNFDQAGLKFEFSFDGGQTFFCPESLNVQLTQSYNRFIFRITNSTNVVVPVYSFAVYF